LLRERFACEGRAKVSRERKGRQADSRCQLEAGSPLGPNAYGKFPGDGILGSYSGPEVLLEGMLCLGAKFAFRSASAEAYSLTTQHSSYITGT
jgi:hypothetical protein